MSPNNPKAAPGGSAHGPAPAGPDVPLLSVRARVNLALGAAVLFLFLTWHLAVVATGAGLGPGDWQVTLGALAHGHPLSGLGHAANAQTGVLGTAAPPRVVVAGATWRVAAFLGVELMAAGWLLIAFYRKAIGPWQSRRAAAGRVRPGFATEATVATALSLPKARASAEHTRPGLSPTARVGAGVEAVGLQLGTTAAGTPVVVALEDHVLVLAPTGAGKTRDVMIPAALSAPGALVLTATRADALDVIAAHRTTGGRRLFVFDPLDRLGWPDPVVWDPVAGARSGRVAQSRAAAFAAALAVDAGTTNGGFFRRNATTALTCLLHAADLAGADMGTVLDWALRLHDGATEPAEIIRTAPAPPAQRRWAAMLTSLATGAAETVASTRQTLAQAIEPIALDEVLACVRPAPGVELFDAGAFIAGGRDTLVLVADANTATNVAPLCAMLLQEIVDGAKAHAARCPGGRLDPPLRIVGDEIANIAPLPKLPEIASDARGFGIQLILALQSLPQAEHRWGPTAARALIENMPAQLLLGGLSDPATLTRYADLLGKVETTRTHDSYDPATGRGLSTGTHTTERPVMSGDEIRRIPDRHGLLVHRNHPPVMLTMTPWFDRPDAPALTAAAAAARAARTVAPR